MYLSFRWLIGEDIFVSYSRADGLRYATALANELSGRGFACRIDQYDTSPGVEIPGHLKRSIRHCRMMVVVASDRASSSERVQQEIAEFLERGRRGQLVLICFGETAKPAVWQSLVQGLPLNQENIDTLAAGKPSLSIVDLINNSFQFRKRNRRMFQSLVGMGALTAIVGAIGFLLVRQVQDDLGRASAERDRAALERDRLGAENTKQRDAIEASGKELNQVRENVRVQQGEVMRQTGINEALRSIGDGDIRRRARGYSSPKDLLNVLQSAATLRSAGRRAEAQAALAETLALQPRLKAIMTNQGRIGGVGLIAQGKRLVTVGSPTRIWDITRGHEIESLPERVISVAVSADGARFLTVTPSGEARVRDSGSLEVIGMWSCAGPHDPFRFALSPDGSAAALACGGRVRIFDVASGAQKTAFSRAGYVSDLRLGGRDGLVAVVYDLGDSQQYRLVVHNATTGAEVNAGHCSIGTRSFVVDPLARTVTNSCDQGSQTSDSSYCEVEVCKLGAATADARFPIQGRAIARFNDDASLLVTSEGGLVRVWSLPDGKPVSSLGLRLFSAEMRFSRDSRYLAGQADAQVWVIHVPTGDLSLMLDLPSKSKLLALSNDGEVLVTGDLASGALQFWEAATVHSPVDVHFAGVATGVSFSPDGRYFIASGKRVRGSETDWSQVWDRTTRSRITEFSTNEIDEERSGRRQAAEKLEGYRQSGVPASDLDFLRRNLPPRDSFRFVNGGRLAVSTSGVPNSVRLWDLRKRAPVAVSVPLAFESQPVLSTDGRYLVARGSTVVDVGSGHVVFKAEYPVLAVTRSGFAVTGEFGLARIWNMSTGEVEARIRLVDMPAGISFSPDEKEIAIAAGSRVQIWSWRLDQLMSEACGLISNNARAAPWTALAAERAYREVCSALK